MKKPDTSLFQLIRELSRTEKRHVKIFAGLHRKGAERKITELFDSIAAQEHYDEEALKKKFSADPFLGKHFKKAKQDLFELILKSLCLYHEDRYSEARIAGRLQKARILADKGVYKAAARILSGAAKDAEKYEHYWLLSRIQEEKIYFLLNRQFNPGGDEKQFSGTFGDFFSAWNSYSSNMKFYKEYFFIVYDLHKEGSSRSGSRFENYKTIARSLPKVTPSSLPLRSRLHYYLFRHMFYFAQNNYPEAFKYTSAAVNCFSKSLPPEYSRLQYVLITDFINICFMLKRYRLIPPALEKLKNIQSTSGPLQHRIRAMQVIMSAGFFIQTGKFQKAKEITGKTLSDREHTEFFSIEQQIIIHYYMAVACFGTGALKESIQWLNRLFTNFNLSNLRTDILVFARFLGIIVHYELGNTDLVEYLTRSVYRFLLRHQRLYKFEDLFLSFIRNRLPGADTKSRLLDNFRYLKTELEKLSSDSYERKPFEYFDFISWLESKIEKKTFAEVVKSKAGKTV